MTTVNNSLIKLENTVNRLCNTVEDLVNSQKLQTNESNYNSSMQANADNQLQIVALTQDQVVALTEVLEKITMPIVYSNYSQSYVPVSQITAKRMTNRGGATGAASSAAEYAANTSTVTPTVTSKPSTVTTQRILIPVNRVAFELAARIH